MNILLENVNSMIIRIVKIEWCAKSKSGRSINRLSSYDEL